MVVNSIETKLRDSSIGLVGEDVLYMQGGTLGVMMNDAVTMLGGGDAPGGVPLRELLQRAAAHQTAPS